MPLHLSGLAYAQTPVRELRTYLNQDKLRRRIEYGSQRKDQPVNLVQRRVVPQRSQQVALLLGGQQRVACRVKPTTAMTGRIRSKE